MYVELNASKIKSCWWQKVETGIELSILKEKKKLREKRRKKENVKIANFWLVFALYRAMK